MAVQRLGVLTCTLRLWSFLLPCPEAECAVQCLTDGKSIIMEGMHLDPGLYLYEFARYSRRI